MNKNGDPAIWDLVLEDMKNRDKKGVQTYGNRLYPFNGRNALYDAYEEALDLAVYLRQAIYEQESAQKDDLSYKIEEVRNNLDTLIKQLRTLPAFQVAKHIEDLLARLTTHS